MNPPQVDTSEAKKLSEDGQRELLQKIRKRYEQGAGANELNRRNHTADLEFVYGADQQMQWDPAVLQLRAGRPSYTFNRVLQPVNLLIGDQRQTRPAIKVRPASKNATPKVAEIFGGLWRSIEQESRADAVYDECYKQAVAGGFGELRILPQYESDQSFNQVLRIRHIPNPLTVVRDPESTDPCGADAMWVMVGDRISEDTYKELYPDFGPPTSFQMARDSLGWRTDGMIRIVEYFEKVAIKKQIAELDDNRVVDYDDKAKAVEAHLANNPDVKAARIKRKRWVKAFKVRWVKVDGAQVLEGPIEYNWQRIPVVRMPGRYINIEGRQLVQSFVRHSWDAQRAYNFQSSDAIERSALIPKSRYLVTSKMINGFDDIWNTANVTPRMYLPYNVDKDAPNNGMPFREQPIDVPAGAVAMAQKAAQDIQATLGIFDPALGNADDMNRVSGKALVTHTRRSDLGSHEFIDSYGKALQLLAEMGLDMIPTVYDSERVLRILKGDDEEDQISVNGEGMPNLTEGRYDCVVTLGPSYQTARQETLATLIDAAQTIPAFQQVVPDLIAKAIDSSYSEEMSKRLRGLLIRQGVIQPGPRDPPQPPQQPDPMAMAELARANALAARDTAQAQIAGSKANASALETHRAVLDAAGRHLANLTLAMKLGQPQEAATAEGQEAALTRVPAQPVQ